jgi:hypothetical protein
MTRFQRRGRPPRAQPSRERRVNGLVVANSTVADATSNHHYPAPVLKRTAKLNAPLRGDSNHKLPRLTRIAFPDAEQIALAAEEKLAADDDG